MKTVPTLSICVPSRNRQFFFQHAIRALTRSKRSDVEFIFVDNSDDPSIMDQFIAPFLSDSRICYVSSGVKTRSMTDNWEMGMNAATGRWVTFIGDDDHCDPEAACIIERIETESPGVEAIDWAKLFYVWADFDKPAGSQMISLHTEIHAVDKELLMDRAFKWQDASHVLCSGFSIYHGAVSRRLIDRIRAAYGGRFFEYPVVDYESLFKIIAHGESFVHCRRPLSILGACPLSNSAAIHDRVKLQQALDIFNLESGSPLDKMACFKDYPFKSALGVIACIGMAHHWFSLRSGKPMSGFEKNFARSASAQCSLITDRESFDAVSEAYRHAFSHWKGGRYKKHFQPKFCPPSTQPDFYGVWQQSLYLNADNPWCGSVVDYYDLVSAVLAPIGELTMDLGRYQAISHRAAL